MIPAEAVALTKALQDNAERLGLTWEIRLATVVSLTDSPALVFDNDDTPVTSGVTNMLGTRPPLGARVYAMSIPPSGVYIVGWAQLREPIGVEAARSLSAQALPTTSPTVVAWDMKTDPYGFMAPLSPTTSQIVIPPGFGGVYTLTAALNITATGTRNFITIFEGANRFVRASLDPGEDYGAVSGTQHFDDGDVITVDAFQNSGALGAMVGIFRMYRW